MQKTSFPGNKTGAAGLLISFMFVLSLLTYSFLEAKNARIQKLVREEKILLEKMEELNSSQIKGL
jgi:hypothetical protein